MFSSSIKNGLVNAYKAAFDALATPAVFTHTKTGVTANLQIGIKTASPQDVAITNAYGIDARIVTMKTSDFTGAAPEKFDSILLGTERIVLAAVHIHRVNDVPVFFKGYVRGHS